MIDIDLRAKEHPMYGPATRRCAVKCSRCDWTGYRTGHFLLDLGQRLDYPTASAAIKGTSDGRECPRCGEMVVFLRVSQRNRNP